MTLFYSITRTLYMPFDMAIVTIRHFPYKVISALVTNILIPILFAILLSSCATTRWHAIEEIPAEETAYVRDSVYVSGDYIRNASISEIDGIPIDMQSQDLIKISLGIHNIKVNCDEASGTFDSNNLLGKSKVLTFEAKVQRTYVIHCLPYTHWWIEDSENHSIVAGEKPAKL